MSYIWEHKDWPRFAYDFSGIQGILEAYIRESSSLSGGLAQLPDGAQNDAVLDLMVSEAIKTSEIEGEKLDREDVRSSIRHQLGFTKKPERLKDPRAMGMAKLMVSVRNDYAQPLTQETLFDWHRMILCGSPQSSTLEIGRWRTYGDPMQIVSGPIGSEIVHYEAPPSARVAQEMTAFISWFSQDLKTPGPVKAAIAHLYFECVHPFSDGNGRIGRALSEKALSQDLQQPVLLSLSTQIEKNRNAYYHELCLASQGDLTVTRWVHYFVKMVYAAQLEAKDQINFILQKANFWARYASQLNDRQTKVLARVFKEGPSGFKGDLTAQKYMKIADCSKATATRDLAELLAYGCLERLPGGGRSTRYGVRVG